jgi:hypothetical protein
MPARFNAYPPDDAALVRLLDDNVPYRIGRASDCEVRIEHFSVSRFHAELQGSASGWILRDTSSKNGVRVGGRLVPQASMEKNTWFAIGDVYCSLEPLDAAAAQAVRAQAQGRREISRRLSGRLSAAHDIGSLIPQSLDVVLELSGLERGFVLYAQEGQALRVHATRGLQAGDIAKRDFGGSIAAVDRALETRRSVVCCDTDDSPWLGARPSVRLGGIRAIVCAPLLVADQAVGVIYADSRAPGPPVTELDLELFESVAQHTADTIAVRRLRDEVENLLATAADTGLSAPYWDDLRRRAETD